MRPEAIYTIGYGGISVPNFIRAVGEYNVDMVVDVRRTPYGRNRAFNERALSTVLPQYESFRGLGNSKEARPGQWLPVDPIQAERSLCRLADAINSGTRVLLLCCERSHVGCHREIIAEELALRTGVPVRHLPEPDQASLFA